MRCAWGKHDGMKSKRECTYRRELDMTTLVATRGRKFCNRSTGAKAAVPEVRITTGGRYLEVSKHPMADAG
jgi:hypothetical protein